MKKLANILVKYRLFFFIVSVTLAVLCAFLIPKVTINKDQSKYLAKDSNMSQGLEIINKEFPPVAMKDSFQIMFEGLTPAEKSVIHEQLATFDGVTVVDYDANSVEHNSKTFAMYIVHTMYTSDSDSVGAIIDEMHEKYGDTHRVFSYYAGGQLDVLDRLVPMAITIGMIILLLMCRSFFEPVLLLVSIGIAILINMGTNVIFESVSDMTFSIAAIFQLVLSIDYSIMLLHRYEQEYELLGRQNKPKAMRNAIVNAFGSVSSSSVTTIVSLLVLLMMSFTIGKDIGLVISKGVFLSVICVFTVMPSLIIWFDELVYKLDKKALKSKLAKRAEKGGNGDV
jgi:predicted RND superfamily exporter protein